MTRYDPVRACRARLWRALCRRFAVYRVARYVFVNKNSADRSSWQGRAKPPVASPLHFAPVPCFRSNIMLTSYQEV